VAKLNETQAARERFYLCLVCGSPDRRANFKTCLDCGPIKYRTGDLAKRRADIHSQRLCVCTMCATVPVSEYGKLCARCKATMVGGRNGRRAKVIEALGGACQCCGLDDATILELDHIHGGGTEERKTVGNASHAVYSNALRKGVPKDEYQLLCPNCHTRKTKLGRCDCRAHSVPGLCSVF
jgi:hypothetical protein